MKGSHHPRIEEERTVEMGPELFSKPRLKELAISHAALWIAMGAAILWRGYCFGNEDQALYLPFILKWNAPSLFPHDILLDQGFAKLSGTWVGISLLSRVVNLQVLSLLLYILASYLVLCFRLDPLRSPFIAFRDLPPALFDERHSRRWVEWIKQIHALQVTGGHWCRDGSVPLGRAEFLALAERYRDIHLSYIVAKPPYALPAVCSAGGRVLYRIDGSPGLKGTK
jgi:hypothetical protein